MADGPPEDADWTVEAAKSLFAFRFPSQHDRQGADAWGLEREGVGSLPLDGKGQLPRARAGLDDDVGLFDTAG